MAAGARTDTGRSAVRIRPGGYFSFVCCFSVVFFGVSFFVCGILFIFRTIFGDEYVSRLLRYYIVLLLVVSLVGVVFASVFVCYPIKVEVFPVGPPVYF